MRRAAISIPSNIAEGYQCGSDKELLHYLRITLGSSAELETQLLIIEKLGYGQTEQRSAAIAANSEVGKMLNSFIMRLTKSNC